MRSLVTAVKADGVDKPETPDFAHTYEDDTIPVLSSPR